MGPGQHRSLQWRPQQGHAVWARSRGSPGQHPDVLLTHRERYYITTVYCIIMMFFSITMHCIFILHYYIVLHVHYYNVLHHYNVLHYLYEIQEEQRINIGEIKLFVKKMLLIYTTVV